MLRRALGGPFGRAYLACAVGVWSLVAVACGSAPKRVATAPQKPRADAARPQARDVAPPPLPSAEQPSVSAESVPAQEPPSPLFEPASPGPARTFVERQAEPAVIDTFLAPATADPPPPSPETAQAVVDGLDTRDFDIPIPLNEKVLSYVELFSGRLKGYLEEGLNRGARYLPMVHEIFRSEGVPLDLAYVPLIESAFKPSALSKAKARGIWQFMRGTGLENGLRHDWYIDERADPEKATRAAAKYLKYLHQKFEGDWHLALASYNGGWGRVRRAMRASGKTDFWEVSSSRRFLPRETRDYVPLILAAVIVARNPAHYGLTLQPAPDVPNEVVAVSAPVDLRRVAEWTATPLETLQDLNPELRRWTTPARAGDYLLRVPQGTGEVVRARAVESGDAPDPFNRHIVQKGETLASIAKKLRVTRADLAEANYLSERTRLSAGQRLIVPKAPSLFDGPDGAADVLLAVAGDGEGDAVVASARAPRASSSAEPRIHRVKRGETLTSLARRYHTSVASLRAWNRLSGSTIRIGQRLTIRPSGSTLAD